MKMIILMATLLFCVTSFAQNGAWRPIDAVKTSAAYWSKQICENKTGQICKFALDPRRVKRGFLMPVVAESIDCADSVACQSQIDGDVFTCAVGVPSFDDKANWPTLDFEADGRSSQGWFLWCQQEDLVLDSAGDAAADAEDASKAQEKSDRATKAGQRDASLKQCVLRFLRRRESSIGKSRSCSQSVRCQSGFPARLQIALAS